MGIERRTSLVIADAREDERCSSVEIGLARSVMVVPISSSEGVVIGVLLFFLPVVNVFDETQPRLVEAAAVQLATR